MVLVCEGVCVWVGGAGRCVGGRADGWASWVARAEGRTRGLSSIASRPSNIGWRLSSAGDLLTRSREQYFAMLVKHAQHVGRPKNLHHLYRRLYRYLYLYLYLT